MANPYDYLSSPHQQENEFVSGLLQGGVTFTGILERYLQTKELISQHTKQLAALETSHEQHHEQLQDMTKDVETLQKLREEETRLRQQLDLGLKQLEIQVKTNTQTIKSIQMKLNLADSTSSITTVEDMSQEEGEKEKEGDIMSRLLAIEKQVQRNTQILVERDITQRLSELEQKFNEQSDYQLKMIEHLFKEHEKLHEKVDELSAKVEVKEQPSTAAVSTSPTGNGTTAGIIRRLRSSTINIAKRRSLPVPLSPEGDSSYNNGSILESYEEIHGAENSLPRDDELMESGYRSRSTSEVTSLSTALLKSPLLASIKPKDTSTPR